jgi:hypothetical protein
MRLGEKPDICPQGERGIGLGLPFNQTRPILLKWSRAGSVKLKAASRGLELYTSFTGIGSLGFYIARWQLNTFHVLTLSNEFFRFITGLHFYLCHTNTHTHALSSNQTGCHPQMLSSGRLL